MGLFNRNQPKKDNDKQDDAHSDDVISSLLSDPNELDAGTASGTSKGVTLGYDEELDAGMARFKQAQANPSEAEAFAQAMGETGESPSNSTFNFTDEPEQNADFETMSADHFEDTFKEEKFIEDKFNDATHTEYDAQYNEAPPYFMEDPRTPYTDTRNTQSAKTSRPESLPSITSGDMASPQRARLSSHKPIPSQSKNVRSAKKPVEPTGKPVGSPNRNPAPASPGDRQRQSRPNTPAVAQPRYGIADAIKLLRQLPETGDVTVLMTIVKRTLETAGIRISDIINDAHRHRQKIQGRMDQLEGEIRKLEIQMQARTSEISELSTQLTETEQVQELLELAEMPPPTQFECQEEVEAPSALPEDQLVD